jgi:hypothetical protein
MLGLSMKGSIMAGRTIAAINDVCHSREAVPRAVTVMPQTGVGMPAGSSGMSRVSVFRSLITVPLLCAAAASLAGCGGGVSDLFSRDAEWFGRQPRILGRSYALETPPLTEQRSIAPDDLISADGMCAGMAQTSDANAMTESEPATAAPGTPSLPAGIALGRTECEVARYAGRPDNVELSNDPRGDRIAVMTFLKGPRPGIYRFVAGRLAAVERAPVPAAPAKPAAKPKKRATT